MSPTPAAALPMILCGSISHHPASTGASMHRAGYQRLGLPFTYVPFRVTDLASAITGMRALGIRGFGVSMPFKQEVMGYLDAIDPQARRIGAVNTIVNDDGTLTGYNTDAMGAVEALEEVRVVRGSRVLLIGAGGAGRAIAFAVADRGGKLTIGNRDLEKGKALAAGTGAEWQPLTVTERAYDYDIVINATSVGMAETLGASIVAEEAMRPGQVVMDIVYKPMDTELVRRAARRGARAIHGGRMLLHQAAKQFELYTGKQAPLEDMEAALLGQLGAPKPPS